MVQRLLDHAVDHKLCLGNIRFEGLQFRLPMGVELVEGKNERQRTKDDDNRVAPDRGSFEEGDIAAPTANAPAIVPAPSLPRGRGRCGHGAVKSGQSIISR
jgi:hypothetical protein